MKPVLLLLWMFLPFSLQQYVYYPGYYYPQPPVIYYDPYAQPCCSACPLIRISYKCKQRKPAEETSALILQATSQSLPHSELETTMAQTMAHSMQEFPTTNAPEATSVGRSTTMPTVNLHSTTTEMRTLETSSNSRATSMTTEEAETTIVAEASTSIVAREMTAEEVVETVTLPTTVTELRTLEASTNSAAISMKTEVAETTTIAETATAKEMTTEEVAETVTLPSTVTEMRILEASTNSSPTSVTTEEAKTRPIGETTAGEMTTEEVGETGTKMLATAAETTKTEEAEVSASPKVAETINERIEFSSKGWVLISERDEATTQINSGEEITSEYPSTESSTGWIVDETQATEVVFQNYDISIETKMSSSPVLQYISTTLQELSTVTKLNNDLIYTTEEDNGTTKTEDVTIEAKLLPFRLSIAPQKEPVITIETTTESEKNFPNTAVTHSATAGHFTSSEKPPRRKRTRKPKRKTTTVVPSIAVSTTTKAPVAFFPDVDAV